MNALPSPSAQAALQALKGLVMFPPLSTYDERLVTLRQFIEGAERDRVDAERYDFMRRQDWWSSPICAVRRPKYAVKPGHDCPSGTRLDEFIDAARSAEQKGKT